MGLPRRLHLRCDNDVFDGQPYNPMRYFIASLIVGVAMWLVRTVCRVDEQENDLQNYE